MFREKKHDFTFASKDFNGNRRYIATQGPSHLTIVDFFRMIHQYEIDTIVCLANEVEFGRVGRKQRECIDLYF